MNRPKSIYEMPYISSRQFAEHFGLAKSTVNRWIKEGKLTSIRLGNKNLIPQDEFKRIDERFTVIL